MSNVEEMAARDHIADRLKTVLSSMPNASASSREEALTRNAAHAIYLRDERIRNMEAIIRDQNDTALMSALLFICESKGLTFPDGEGPDSPEALTEFLCDLIRAYAVIERETEDEIIVGDKLYDGWNGIEHTVRAIVDGQLVLSFESPKHKGRLGYEIIDPYLVADPGQDVTSAAQYSRTPPSKKAKS